MNLVADYSSSEEEKEKTKAPIEIIKKPKIFTLNTADDDIEWVAKQEQKPLIVTETKVKLSEMLPPPVHASKKKSEDSLFQKQVSVKKEQLDSQQEVESSQTQVSVDKTITPEALSKLHGSSYLRKHGADSVVFQEIFQHKQIEQSASERIAAKEHLESIKIGLDSNDTNIVQLTKKVRYQEYSNQMDSMRKEGKSKYGF